ncbi:LysR family transcriptional regulator [Granulibacter bethesdensis]|uniref:Transcriptional regulator, LysR family n=1 Tax=Granulibacter bethesdensis (strain ATCC BAA-1260 / CGDNIH1) TaxID=391165 RepID=Q0BT98_GRABC|nr:LysR family transcriptional regulator [Granulibacter bethesdensis]ABI61954.1 Transcriptional regulator, LysR family [Granulibacter bethesdensis CGDNIH1]APG30623.1 Transcriptional regulator, LysR family [Granulibacter bethesdensis]APH51770.1 Transcriptional regulator, LysR family [Granulibacter bethesdensis]APH64462.1 Transcriptional regulator, LysR family [Granulibacter bethesdensis]
MIGSLTLDQLRVLTTIADAGSFSAAGRKLGRAQSAISQAVATLEDVQGVILFDRSGFRPVLTDVGRVLVAQARTVLAGAAQFEAVAAGTREGVEPELAVAIDPLVPTAAFIDSLHALRAAFPFLPVSFSTEGLGGAERRLRRGDAALALCILLPGVPEDVVALPLLGIDLVPVVSPAHPLAGLGRSATPADLEEHVQLVLSDPAAPDGPSYGIIGTRPWRFVDLARRLDFLLAGLGWCRMPEHLVAPYLADGRLLALAIEGDPARATGPLTIYAARMRDRALGRAGSWLLNELQARLA